jgi:hypothetical protein
MPHRDDRDALDAKLDAQARELAEAKEELDRLRAANQRKATELERLRLAPPQEPSPGSPPRRDVHRPLGVLVAAASLLVGGLSFSAIHLAARSHCRSHACSLAAVRAVPTHAVFHARVARTAGLSPIAVDEACRVDVTFEADARTRVHAVSALAVTCGDDTIYAPPTSQLADSIGVAWASESDGHARYELAHVAGATRIDSWDGVAVIATRGARVEFAIDPLSDEVELALPPDAPTERTIVRTGHITTSTAMLAGTACIVARRPAVAEGFASRVVVRCDDRTLYGADSTGYTYAGSDARLVVDEQSSRADGDPRLTLDLIQGNVHLEDGFALGLVTVDIALDATH